MVIMIIARINTWYEAQLLDQQQGFRTGRGTTDGIFVAKALHQITKRMGKETYVLFVDLTAAFDHIDRRWLFKTIKQRLENEIYCKLFDLLEVLYSSTTSALAGHELDKFVIELGVRQEGAESPLLFNLYIDYVIRQFLAECTTNKLILLKLNMRFRRQRWLQTVFSENTGKTHSTGLDTRTMYSLPLKIVQT